VPCFALLVLVLVLGWPGLHVVPENLHIHAQQQLDSTVSWQ
jgi:hypothetical protein